MVPREVEVLVLVEVELLLGRVVVVVVASPREVVVEVLVEVVGRVVVVLDDSPRDVVVVASPRELLLVEVEVLADGVRELVVVEVRLEEVVVDEPAARRTSAALTTPRLLPLLVGV